MQLLLLSNSRNERGYLEDYRAAISAIAAGAREALFVPYARLSQWDEYRTLVADALEPIGIRVASVHRSRNAVEAISNAKMILVGGGNTFHLLHQCRKRGLLGPIARRVRAGIPYVGWSAGSNLACPTIRTTNDMPIVDPGGLEALGLVDFQLNPHYVNFVQPNFRGETRDQRLAEFTTCNPRMPVLGLPEGDYVRVSGSRLTLAGPKPAKWFLGTQPPKRVRPGPLKRPRP
jgi:dipeptidase E